MRSTLWVVLVLLMAAAGWAQDADDEFKLARNLFRDAGDYATAAELFADFIRNRPDSRHLADARLMLARSYGRSGRCGEAIGAYEEFYLEHPDHLSTAEARRERGACLEAEGDYAAAARAYAEVQRRFSESEFAAQSLLDAGANFARAGDLAAALTSYRTVIADYGKDERALAARYRLAQLYFVGGQAAAAQQYLEQITAAAPKSTVARDAHLLAGRIFLFLGRRPSARQVFARLEEDFPGSTHADSARLDLATDLYTAGQYREAAAAFVRARDQAGEKSLARRAELGLADALRYDGQYREALEIYTAVAADLPAASPLRDAARVGQAICYGYSGQRAAAVRLFQELSLSGNPGLGTGAASSPTPAAAASLRELGALYRRDGDLTRAITWFRRYLDEAARAGEGFPESPLDRNRTQLQLAQVYDAAGFHGEAAETYATLTGGGTAPDLAAEALFGLAVAREHGGQRDLAIREYTAFLERFPVHRRAVQARDRIEYLTDFAIADAAGLDRALQQALIDELSGRPRQRLLLDLARALRRHQDYGNAVRTFETYAAAYRDDPTAAEAQYYLAESLHRLARQRRLENRPATADSLLELALQEDRILAEAGHGEWSAESRLRLAEVAAERAPDSLRLDLRESGYRAFLSDSTFADPAGVDLASPARARALVGLGDALRERGAADSSRYGEAAAAYAEVLRVAPAGAARAHARFGLALCHLARGQADAAVDSLSDLLRQVRDASLQPRVLHVLGRALLERGDAREAVVRFQELLLAFPSYPQRRGAQEQLAETHFDLGEYALAAELYRQLHESDPLADPNGALRRRLAESRHRQGQHAAALELYTDLLDELPNAVAADSMRLARGQLLVALERPDEALEAFATIARRAPGSGMAAVARRHRADLLFGLGRFDEAYGDYEPLLMGDTVEPGAYGRAIVCLYQLKRPKNAATAIKEFRKRYGKDSPWLVLFRLQEGEYLLRQRQWEKALKALADVAEGGAPGDSAALGLRDPHLRQLATDPVTAAAYLTATARWEQSLAEPTEEGSLRALEAQNAFLASHGASSFAAPVHLRLGNYHFTLGRYLPAAGAYRRVLDGDATLAQRRDAIWQLLQCYIKAFEYDQAQRTATRLLREFPEHPQSNAVQLEIGYILIQRGQFPEAISFLERVLEWAKANDAAEARFFIGQAYQQMSDYRKAIEHYYRVAFLGADASSQWITSADFQRAMCHEELGEYATAANIYDRIIQRDGSGSEFGRMAQERLSKLPATEGARHGQ